MGCFWRGVRDMKKHGYQGGRIGIDNGSAGTDISQSLIQYVTQIAHHLLLGNFIPEFALAADDCTSALNFARDMYCAMKKA
jgi:hypothetical protein